MKDERKSRFWKEWMGYERGETRPLGHGVVIPKLDAALAQCK